MTVLLKKLPYPVAGLMLGLASLGNLLLSYGAGYRYALGVLAGLIFIAIIAKTISHPQDLESALQQTPIAAVLPTFSMGMSLLAAYIRPHWALGGHAMWWVALLIHLALLVFFTVRHALPFNFKKLLPSWFIVYVGLGAFSLTAPAFGQRPLGQWTFWFAVVAYFTLLVPVLYRLFVVKGIPLALLPTAAILVAPSSLTLVGYLNSFPERSLTIIYLLLSCTVLSFIGVALAMPRLLRLPFAPSFSAFTFPFVIAAIAVKAGSAYLTQQGAPIALLAHTAAFLELIAVVLVGFVLYRYSVFMFASPPVVKP